MKTFADYVRGMLTVEEGRRLVGYPDTEGVPTIGIGHTGPEVHIGLVWTPAQVEAAFAEDLPDATHYVASRFPWADSIADARRGVLIGMVFQMGIGTSPTPTHAGTGVLAFVKTLAAMRDGHWDNAAAEMLDSRWAKQTPARARRMSRQVATGQWQYAPTTVVA